MPMLKFNTFELGINQLKLKRKYHEMGIVKFKFVPKKSKTSLRVRRFIYHDLSRICWINFDISNELCHDMSQ